MKINNYKRRDQQGLFDKEATSSKLSKLGNPLEKLHKVKNTNKSRSPYADLITRRDFIKTTAFAMGMAAMPGCGPGEEPQPSKPTELTLPTIPTAADIDRLRIQANQTGISFKIRASGDIGITSADLLSPLGELLYRPNVVGVEWGGYTVYPAADLGVLATDHVHALAKILGKGAGLSAQAGKQFSLSLADKGLIPAQYHANLVFATDVVIETAAEFASKCATASAGQIIVIKGNITLNTDAATPLADAATRGAAIRIDSGGGLKFTVARNVDLGKLGFGAICAALGFGRGVINMDVATDPTTTIPFITAVNQTILEGMKTPGTPNKKDYNLNFGTVHPVISGTHDNPATKDFYANICEITIDYGLGKGICEILMNSNKQLETRFFDGTFLNSPLIKGDQNNIIKFKYPTLSEAGNEYIHPDVTTLWGVNYGRRVKFDVSEWVMAAGQYPEMFVHLGLYHNDSKVWLYGDQLAACHDYRAYFVQSQTLAGWPVTVVNDMKHFFQRGEGLPSHLRVVSSKDDSDLDEIPPFFGQTAPGDYNYPAPPQYQLPIFRLNPNRQMVYGSFNQFMS